MANKGEQVKMVIENMRVNSWCSWSCSCGYVEIQNGTYADGSTPTTMCSYLLGKITIYSQVGYGLKIQAAHFAFWWAHFQFRASYTVISHKDILSDGKKSQEMRILAPAKCR